MDSSLLLLESCYAFVQDFLFIKVLAFFNFIGAIGYSVSGAGFIAWKHQIIVSPSLNPTTHPWNASPEPACFL